MANGGTKSILHTPFPPGGDGVVICAGSVVQWRGIGPGADLRGGGVLPARPPPFRAILIREGGGGGLFPVDLSVQTANT